MRYLLGIDLGGTHMAAGVVTEDGALLSKADAPTGVGRPVGAIVDDMAETARRSLAQAGLTAADVSALGVGVPGAVDDSTGMVLFATNLHWHQIPLGQMLGQALGVPVRLGNDADCAALGEALVGGARDYDSSLMITIGTGIGGGLVSGRRLFTGWSGVGIEPGHFTLVAGGIPCNCGSRGCFECYASATALIRQTQEAMVAHPTSALWSVAGSTEQVSAKTPFDAALLGDETAKAVLDQYEEHLAAGIGGIVNLFRPHVVVLGGGVSGQGETLLVPLRSKLKKYCYASDYIAPPAVLQAVLGNDAGIIGAALLCL